MPSFLRLLPVLVAVVAAARTTAIAKVGLFDDFTDSPWAYWLLALTAVLTEELSPILGGIAVSNEDLEMPRVIFAVSLGAWIFTSALYILGRLKWEWIRRRFPKVRATGTVALRAVARNPITTSFLVRFAFGLRIVLPMACGAARVPLTIFIPATLVGSIAWSVLFAFTGYAAGDVAVTVLGHFGRVGQVLTVLIVGGLVLGFVRWNKRRARRKVERREAAACRATAEARAAVE
jgi:membrane protein DedA with SNARE-associated domain